jgi:K+-transporting ATPase ATPase A chain
MGWLQSLVYVVALTVLAVPLGEFMARVYLGRATTLARVFGPLERLTYRVAGVREEDEMGWKRYGRSVLVFSVVGFLFVFLLQRLQSLLPLNPAAQTAVSPDSSFNTAVSFGSNTNWQSYGGESDASATSPRWPRSRCRTSCLRPPAWRASWRSSAASPGKRPTPSAASGST